MNDSKTPDYGSDPIGDGTFRMIPSGDIVSIGERMSRLSHLQSNNIRIDCLGMTWEQIATKQGGLNTLDITREKKGRR